VASSSLPVSKIALPIGGVSSWLFYPLLSFGLPPAISAVQRLQSFRLGHRTRTIGKEKAKQTSVLGPSKMQICIFAALPIADGPKEQWVVEQRACPNFCVNGSDFN
jgi:hypothetical protein